MKTSITPEIANNIINLNDADYLQWADGSQITNDELCQLFEIEIVSEDLRFKPTFNLVHKSEDFNINDVYVITDEDQIGCHFEDLYSPETVQYSWNGLLLQESSADRNTLEEIQEMSGTTEAQYCDVEGLYPHTFYVSNGEFGTKF